MFKVAQIPGIEAILFLESVPREKQELKIIGLGVSLAFANAQYGRTKMKWSVHKMG